MNILLLGKNGQLGWELTQSCPDQISLFTCDFPEVDFLDAGSLDACLDTQSFDWVINAVAYTAVDQAEKEPEKADRINHLAVAEIAQKCKAKKIRLVHVSTDYVFSGRHYLPIAPEADPAPESVYGSTKLAGEKKIRSILPDQAAVIRTAWLYSAHGANFVKTMIRLMQEKDQLTVVDDQIGTPTWAAGLAQAIWKTIEKNLAGTFHYTDAGVASWYDFAAAIQEEALALGLLENQIPLGPIPTSAYPTPAVRPAYSVLNTRDFYAALESRPRHWREQLRKMLKSYENTL